MDKFTRTRSIKLGLKIIALLSFFNSFSQSIDQYKTTIASGSVNVYTIPNADWGEYRPNEKWLVDFTGVTTNSGSATLNRHSLGAKSIKMPDGSDVSSGTLKGRVQLSYNGTYFYIVGGSSSGGGGTCSTCWQTSGTSNLSASATINTSANPLFIGNSNSGVHFNTTYASGAAKYALWSTDQTVGNGTAMGVGNLDGGGDGSYAAIIGGAGGNEITMAAANDAGEYAEFWIQANKLGGAFDIILSDHRSTPRGIEYEFSGYENTGSDRTLTSRGYVLGAKTFTGKQTFLTSTTGSASINIPNGATPTSPSNGDIWGQGNHLFARLNGISYQLDQQPISGISGLGSGISTWLATPSSSNLASALTDETGSGSAVFGASPTIGNLNLSAGSSSLSPIQFTIGGSLTSSPSAGQLQPDPSTGLLTYSHNTNENGVVAAEQFILSNSTYTLTSQTALQKMFNSPSNGAVTVKSGTTYYFECEFDLSSLSASSGSFSFGFLGTATFNSLKYQSICAKATTAGTTGFVYSISTTASAFVISSSNTLTTGFATIKGYLRVNAGGTVIPSIGMSVAAAAVVSANSRFMLRPIGSNTVVSFGNWN